MPTPLSDERVREQARRDVAAKMGWFIHLMVYLLVNAFLIIIWMMTGRGYPWFAWVLGVWGIGLVAHFILVFFGHRPIGWERGETDDQADRMRPQQ